MTTGYIFGYIKKSDLQKGKADQQANYQGVVEILVIYSKLILK